MQFSIHVRPNMNWQADKWFAKHHAYKLDDTFKKWWLFFYGEPSDYGDSEDEQREYWVRCAFTLTGWRARNQEFIDAYKKIVRVC